MTMEPRYSAKGLLLGLAASLLAMMASGGSAAASGSNGGVSVNVHSGAHHHGFGFRNRDAAIFDDGTCCGPFFDGDNNNTPSVVIINGTRYVALPPVLPSRLRPAELKFSSETVHDVEITRGPPSTR